jgi:sulfite reductase alpha subunit-like flavoprotein
VLERFERSPEDRTLVYEECTHSHTNIIHFTLLSFIIYLYSDFYTLVSTHRSEQLIRVLVKSNMSSESGEERTILVLYGSQTGNAQQAAEEFTQQCREQRGWSADCLSLDDLLEVRHCRFTRYMVIFVSSYGHGGPPLGGYRFRDLCDHWLEDEKGSDDTTQPKLLQGVHYALCGLGDSKYMTFFQNPTVTDRALQRMGAHRVGPIGQADAGVKPGKPPQEAVIAEWIAGIWAPLEKVLASTDETTPIDWRHLQLETMRTCQKINPDFVWPKEFLPDQGVSRLWKQLPWLLFWISSIGVAFLSMLLYHNYSQVSSFSK